jgi:hypothetical protein
MKTDQELIDAFARGTTDHGITKVVMRGEHFVIFRIPGHTYWSSVMKPSAYARSTHVLIRQGEWWMRGKIIKEWEGRVSKKVLKAALDEIERKEGKAKHGKGETNRESDQG